MATNEWCLMVLRATAVELAWWWHGFRRLLSGYPDGAAAGYQAATRVKYFSHAASMVETNKTRQPCGCSNRLGSPSWINHFRTMSTRNDKLINQLSNALFEDGYPWWVASENSGPPQKGWSKWFTISNGLYWLISGDTARWHPLTYVFIVFMVLVWFIIYLLKPLKPLQFEQEI